MSASTSQDARKIRDSKNIDLEFDPPPDLAIEIEITSNSGRRLSIYSALKIPEVWQFDGEILTVLRLQDDGSYRPNDRSEELPFLPMAEIAAFIREYQSVPTLSGPRRSGGGFARRSCPGQGVAARTTEVCACPPSSASTWPRKSDRVARLGRVRRSRSTEFGSHQPGRPAERLGHRPDRGRLDRRRVPDRDRMNAEEVEERSTALRLLTVS